MSQKTSFFKGLFAAGLTLFALTALANFTSAAGEAGINEQPRTVTVTGSGKVKAKADTATIAFDMNVLVTGTATEAQKKNFETLEKVKAALAELGVEEDHINTTWTSISPDYNYDVLPEGTQLKTPNAYRIDHQFSVYTHNLDLVNTIIEKAIGVENVLMQNINYSLEDFSEYLGKARELAAKDAMARAQALGEIFKFKVGDIISVSENNYYGGGYYGGASPSQLDVNLDLGVTFQLLNK